MPCTELLSISSSYYFSNHQLHRNQLRLVQLAQHSLCVIHRVWGRKIFHSVLVQCSFWFAKAAAKFNNQHLCVSEMALWISGCMIYSYVCIILICKQHKSWWRFRGTCSNICGLNLKYRKRHLWRYFVIAGGAGDSFVAGYLQHSSSGWKEATKHHESRCKHERVFEFCESISWSSLCIPLLFYLNVKCVLTYACVYIRHAGDRWLVPRCEWDGLSIPKQNPAWAE